MDWILIVIGLLLSAFFSGLEIAFVSANKLHIELESAKGKWTAQLISELVKKPARFISAMLIGNNITLVIYGISMKHILEPGLEYLNMHPISIFILTTLISTVVVLILAEFFPKAIFSQFPNKILNFLSLPAYVSFYLLSPLVWVFGSLSNGILWLFGQKSAKEISEFTRKDLVNYLTEHTDNIEDNQEVETEINLLKNALNFSNIKARECLIPRTEIIALEHNSSVIELQNRFNKTGFSKIMIYEDEIDKIIGYVHCFDMLKNPQKIENVLVPAIYIPESMMASDILNLFRKENRSLAVVIDEFGGTAGMVCLEDVLEEIFGEIEDEHDESDLIEKRVSNHQFIFSARLEIDYLNEKYQFNLPVSEEYETLGGLISHKLEKIPEINELLEIDNYRLRIKAVEQKLIKEVTITILNTNL